MAVFLRKYGVAATIDGVPLVAAGAVNYQANPTLATGDAKISKDGGAFANLATLPAVTPASGRAVRVALSATEMECARAVVQFVDAAGAEWEDQELIIETYGHASATHAFDLSVATQAVNATQISGSSGAADNLETAALAYSATRGLAGTALPAAAADAAGGLPISDAGSLDLDAKLANTNEITAARMGALTDWLNGGRLDLIIDAILADTGTTLADVLTVIGGNVNAVLADTNELQTDWKNTGRLDVLLDLASTAASDVSDRLTETRADYLDKLNITGNVASADAVAAIQNNTRTTFDLPRLMERPDSGVTRYKLYLNNYDTAGNMEAPDEAPVVACVNSEGTDRSGQLQHPTTHGAQTAMVEISAGRYWIEYELASDDAIESLVFTVSVVEGAATRYFDRVSQVVDTTAVDFTAADRTKLDTLHDTRLTADRATKLDNLDAAVSTRSSHSAADVWSVATRTLTSFGSVVADVATAVWGAASRTLSAFEFTTTPSNAADTTAIKAKTDLLAFTGTDVHATLDGEEVVTDATSRTASKADVSGLATAAGLATAESNIRGADSDTLKTLSDQLDAVGDGSVNITLGPLVGAINPGQRTSSPVALEMFEGEAKTFTLGVLDADEEPVDLSGRTLRFVVQTTANPPVGVFKIEGMAGTAQGVVQVPVTPTESDTASTERYWLLWDTDASEVLQHGSFLIRPAVEDVV